MHRSPINKLSQLRIVSSLIGCTVVGTVARPPPTEIPLGTAILKRQLRCVAGRGSRLACPARVAKCRAPKAFDTTWQRSTVAVQRNTVAVETEAPLNYQ
ncbi:hypothetical protein DFH94DRAFT_757884 [Russula ochroleuca]|uniref:Secreted protein n=1 Tax=Russula ochroleuca TaxID=152965 RepID=A0A9P5MSG6_9AGAM|nr:hypothetical protein DFH94DRAFT_757884 [Russula ochroleuca]